MRVTTDHANDQALRTLIDDHEITALVHRVGACLDEGRFDQLRELYTDDATARTPGGLAEGGDALVAQAARNHSRFARVQHVISDVRITVPADGDTAEVRANLLATFVPDADDLGTYFQLGEVYRFTARRTGPGWRLTSVATTPIWMNGERPAPA